MAFSMKGLGALLGGTPQAEGDPTFGFGLLDTGTKSGLLDLGIGLLAAGAPSFEPRGLGGNIAQGFATARTLGQDREDNRLKREALLEKKAASERELAQQALMMQILGGGGIEGIPPEVGMLLALGGNPGQALGTILAAQNDPSKIQARANLADERSLAENGYADTTEALRAAKYLKSVGGQELFTRFPQLGAVEGAFNAAGEFLGMGSVGSDVVGILDKSGVPPEERPKVLKAIDTLRKTRSRIAGGLADTNAELKNQLVGIGEGNVSLDVGIQALEQAHNLYGGRIANRVNPGETPEDVFKAVEGRLGTNPYATAQPAAPAPATAAAPTPNRVTTSTVLPDGTVLPAGTAPAAPKPPAMRWADPTKLPKVKGLPDPDSLSVDWVRQDPENRRIIRDNNKLFILDRKTGRRRQLTAAEGAALGLGAQ